MSLFSGITRSLINPMSLMQLAMGPAGWASLAMKTIGSQIAMQAIQRLGQSMGLPPAVIDLAQAAFASASGQPGLARQNIAEAVQGFTQQLDLRPSEAGQLQRELMSVSDKSIDNLMKTANPLLEKFKKDAVEGNGGDGESGSGKKANGKGGADSFLVAFAKALGKTMDAKMDKMMDISKKIDQATQTANTEKKQAVTGELSAELQGLSQEMNLVSQAMATSLKSIGESLSTVARKG